MRLFRNTLGIGALVLALSGCANTIARQKMTTIDGIGTRECSNPDGYDGKPLNGMMGFLIGPDIEKYTEEEKRIGRGNFPGGTDQLYGSQQTEGKGINPPQEVYIRVSGDLKRDYSSHPVESHIEVGGRLDLIVHAVDNRSITHANLYEDGVRINDFQVGFYGSAHPENLRPHLSDSVYIIKSEPGVHDYVFEVADEDNNVVRACAVSVNVVPRKQPTAPPTDQIPTVTLTSEYGATVGKTARINVHAFDGGLNQGITRAELYEDGKLIQELDVSKAYLSLDQVVDISKTKVGEHMYRLDVNDRGGHNISSGNLPISFNP